MRVDAEPWVGRDWELAQIERASRQGRDRLRVVAITGEPGIGKTRLAEEFLSRARARGTKVLRSRCDEFLDQAHAPLLELLRQDLDGRDVQQLVLDVGPGGEELARLVPELQGLAGAQGGAARKPVDPALERLRQMEGLAGWLRILGGEGETFLLVDDLQWADAETLAVLEHLLVHHTDLPLVLVFTAREQGGAGASPRLAGAPWSSEPVHQVPLGGLGDDDVRLLLSQELDGHQTARTSEFVRRVCDVSGGNPLLVRELVRRHVAGPVADDAGAGVREAMPSDVHDVILQRAARLPDTVRTCLGVAAVIGREFVPGMLADATGMSPREVDATLAASVAAALVEEYTAAPLRYRFCHEAVRVALYEDLGAMQRSEVHRTVGQLIEGRAVGTDSESHHLAVGHHYGRAADLSLEHRAADHLRRAAVLASDRGAHAAAAHLYVRVEALLRGAVAAEDHCDIVIARGVAEFNAGLPGFRDTLLDAARDAARTGCHDRLVRAVVANHRGWYSSTTDVDEERVDLIQLALLRCPVEDRTAVARLNAMWAMEKVRDPNERRRVIERSVEAVRLAEDLGDPELLVDILCDRFSVMYACFEDPYGAAELAHRIERLARASGNENHLLNAAVAVAQSTMMTGDFRTSDEALELSSSLAERVHRPVRLWLAKVWIATRTAMRGDLEAGESLAGAALEQGTALDQPDAFTWYAGQLFAFRHLDGRLVEMVDTVEEQVAAHVAAVPAWRAALALAFAAGGRTGDARELIGELVAEAGCGMPQDMIRLPGLAFLASAVAEVADVPAARAVYDELLPFTGLFAHNGTIDAGPVDLHLGALAVTLGDLAGASRHLRAASDQCAAASAEGWQRHLERWRAAAAELSARPAGGASDRARIRVLGTFAVVGAGRQEPERWTSRKARTLLKYLVASRGSAVRRDTVLHLLWPDTDPDLLANRFAVALATVRRTLDPDRSCSRQHFVEAGDIVLRLRAEHVEVDLDEFHVAAAAHDRESLHRAVRLYRGDPFMDEPEAPWAVGTRSHARGAWRQAVTRLAHLEAERGDLATAAGLFRRVVEEEPCDEAASRGLARVLALMGEHVEAAAVVADLQSLLEPVARVRPRGPGPSPG